MEDNKEDVITIILSFKAEDGMYVMYYVSQ